MILRGPTDYRQTWYSYLAPRQWASLPTTKDRPCVVVVAVTRDDGDTEVTVAPVTHRPPRVPGEGVEIPAATKMRLGLDEGRSWIIVTEINRFHWPGVDLLPVPGRGGYDHGVLPPGGCFGRSGTALQAGCDCASCGRRRRAVERWRTRKNRENSIMVENALVSLHRLLLRRRLPDQ